MRAAIHYQWDRFRIGVGAAAFHRVLTSHSTWPPRQTTNKVQRGEGRQTMPVKGVRAPSSPQEVPPQSIGRRRQPGQPWSGGPSTGDNDGRTRRLPSAARGTGAGAEREAMRAERRLPFLDTRRTGPGEGAGSSIEALSQKRGLVAVPPNGRDGTRTDVRPVVQGNPRGQGPVPARAVPNPLLVGTSVRGGGPPHRPPSPGATALDLDRNARRACGERVNHADHASSD
jgi:hypothetical protein